MTARIAAVTTVLAVLVCGAQAATMFSDDFGDGTLNANLEDSASAFTESGGVIYHSSGSSAEYVKTVPDDYNTTDFIYEMEVTLNNGGGAGTAYIGYGPGTKKSTFYNKPYGISVEITPDDSGGGFARLLEAWDTGQSEGSSDGAEGGNGTHVVRVSKTGTSLTFSLDTGSTGSFKTIGTVDLSAAPWSTYLTSANSRLFFGTQVDNTTTFNDLDIGQPQHFFSDDFGDGTLNANLEDSASAFTESGGVIYHSSGSSAEYVKTVPDDYNTTDFIYEMEVTLNNGGGAGTAYIGYGPGTKKSTFYNKPYGISVEITPDDSGGGFARLLEAWDTGQSEGSSDGAEGGNGTHVVRVSKTGTSLTFSLDTGSTGSFKTIGTVDLSAAPWSTYLTSANSRLFFGTQVDNTTTFNDLDIGRILKGTLIVIQ